MPVRETIDDRNHYLYSSDRVQYNEYLRRENRLCNQLRLTVVCSLFCGIILLTFFISSISFYANSQKKSEFIVFDNYYVNYDVATKIPLKSSLVTWGYYDLRFMPRLIDDFRTISLRYYGKYSPLLLTPFFDAGNSTVTMLNVAPQLPCMHNKWLIFELTMRINHRGEEIHTYPKYNFTTYLDTPDGKLFIPSYFCKEVRNIETCLEHKC